jgi:hypothetical protein
VQLDRIQETIKLSSLNLRRSVIMVIQSLARKEENTPRARLRLGIKKRKDDQGGCESDSLARFDVSDIGYVCIVGIVGMLWSTKDMI